MAKHIKLEGDTKQEKYENLLPQLKGLIAGELNLIANLANISAALKQSFNWLWVGFYFVENNQLVLGPFQGEVACTRIEKGKGVCGTAWVENKIIIVANVDLYPGHIACSSKSKSEIVIPILKNNTVRLVLDVDSESYNFFDKTDQLYLEKIARLIESVL